MFLYWRVLRYPESPGSVFLGNLDNIPGWIWRCLGMVVRHVWMYVQDIWA